MNRFKIKPNFDGQGKAVSSYKVVDEFGNTIFIGSYTECYYVMFPDADRNYSDKEAFDKAWGLDNV